MKRTAFVVLIVACVTTGCISTPSSDSFSSRDLSIYKNTAYTAGVGSGVAMVDPEDVDSVLKAIQLFDDLNDAIVSISRKRDESYNLGMANSVVDLMSSDAIVVAGLRASIVIQLGIRPDELLNSELELNKAQRDVFANWLAGIRDGLDQRIDVAKKHFDFPEGG